MKTTLSSFSIAIPLLLPLPLLTACGSLGGLQEAVADVVLPPSQAEQLGQRMSREIEAQTRLSPDAALQRRIDRIGRRLLAQQGSSPPGYDYAFKVLQQPGVNNAFALPGGYIYITSGLVDLLGSDEQIAAVIGHEIAHVTERHIAERLATSYGLQAAVSAALGQDPGMLAGMVSSVLQQGALLKYSRNQELEADRVGVRLMRRAGYDPRAAITVFRKLGEGGGGGAPEFLSSHPTHERRIEELRRIVEQGG